MQNLMKYFLKKERFHPFKRHLQQICWAENMPLEADRLVMVPLV